MRWPRAALLLLTAVLGGCSGSSGAGASPTAPSGGGGSGLAASQEMTALPVDAAAVVWVGPFTSEHPGIDLGTAFGGTFFSVGDGVVTNVELNTGQGLAGTNYRINLEYTTMLGAEYHFEIDGSLTEDARRGHVLVAEGQRVTAGQAIGTLASQGEGAHVHFQMYQLSGGGQACPLPHFTTAAAARFQALWESGIEQRSASPDLCN